MKPPAEEAAQGQNNQYEEPEGILRHQFTTGDLAKGIGQQLAQA